jgi:hypothetical protein
MVCGEQVTAGRVQAQPVGLAPRGPHVGEDPGEPGALVDVDRMLVAAAADGDVGDPAGQVVPLKAVGAIRAQPDLGRGGQEVGVE